jgi:hypothetical protein
VQLRDFAQHSQVPLRGPGVELIIEIIELSTIEARTCRHRARDLRQLNERVREDAPDSAEDFELRERPR